MMRGFCCVVASARMTPKPVPCLRCRSRMITSTASRLTAARAADSLSAVPINSTSEICRIASVNLSVNTFESSTSNTRSERTINMSPWTNARRFGRCSTQTCRLLNEAVAQRVGRYVCIRGEAHLFQDSTAIRADGFDAQAEFVGDVRNAPSGRQLAKDLELPRGKPRVQRLVRIPVEIRHQNLGQRGTHIAPSRQHGAHRFHEFFGSTIFRQV